MCFFTYFAETMHHIAAKSKTTTFLNELQMWLIEISGKKKIAQKDVR